MSSHRLSEFAVDPVFTDRWSPRAFTGAPMSVSELFCLFEAARWAPSSHNAQPWRFLYAFRDQAHWRTFLDLLTESNRRWAKDAAALVLLLSKTEHLRAGEPAAAPLRSHSFDAGAAWANFSLQAVWNGWKTRAMGGFDHEKARVALHVPDNFRLEIMIAIGKQGERSSLPANLQEKEIPTQRRPLRELAVEGRFGFED